MNEYIVKNNIMNTLEIIGFIFDNFNMLLIRNAKLSPELLYNYYSKNKNLIKIIYLFGGLILIGKLSNFLYINQNKKNSYFKYSKVQLK